MTIKNKIQNTLNYFGYKIERVDTFYKEDLFFKKLLKKVKKFTMTNSKRIFYLYFSVNYIIKNKIPGEIVECGVWKGGSVMAIVFTLLKNKNKNKRIFLYDTFMGMTKPSKKDYMLKSNISAKNLIEQNEYLRCIANLSEVKNNIYKTN